MKKRNAIITLVVILVVAVLAIGYAAISSQTLVITGNGTITPNDSLFDVHFTQVGTAEFATGTPNTATCTGTIDHANDSTDRTATITVTGFEKEGDAATIAYTVYNASEVYDASVILNTITNSNNTYFEVTVEPITAVELSTTASTDFEVTVTCIKTPIAEQTTTINITLTASPVEQS